MKELLKVLANIFAYVLMSVGIVLALVLITKMFI